MKILCCMVCRNMVVITVFYINICNENLVLYGVWKHGCDYCICNENLVLYGAVITVFYVK